MKWIILGLIGTFLLAGCLEQPTECPVCSEDVSVALASCQEDNDLITESLKDSRNYYKDIVEEERERYLELEELGSQLFDDYWNCYLAFTCYNNIAACNDAFEDGYTVENQRYAETICSLAQDLDYYAGQFGME
jgi:hypothetical protein